MPYFHDATVTARSVPVNVRTGGLKQDLCLLFNKESLTGTEFACRNNQDCPIAEGAVAASLSALCGDDRKTVIQQALSAKTMRKI